MKDINWFGGKGITNPASDSFAADKVDAPKSNNKKEANLWAGEVPKEIPVNINKEIGTLDGRAGALTLAKNAVTQGVKIALVEVPSDFNNVAYDESGGGIYQIVEDNQVIGYAQEVPTKDQA